MNTLSTILFAAVNANAKIIDTTFTGNLKGGYGGYKQCPGDKIGCCQKWYDGDYCNNHIYVDSMHDRCPMWCFGGCQGGDDESTAAPATTTTERTPPPIGPTLYPRITTTAATTKSSDEVVPAGRCPGDKGGFCSGWNAAGYCTNEIYIPVMMENCSAWCHGCNADEKSTGCPPDAPPFCDDWMSQGMCNDPAYASTMMYHCGAWCEGCQNTVPDVDVDESCREGTPSFCSIWKDSGYCEDPMFKSVMMDNCAVWCTGC